MYSPGDLLKIDEPNKHLDSCSYPTRRLAMVVEDCGAAGVKVRLARRRGIRPSHGDFAPMALLVPRRSVRSIENSEDAAPPDELLRSDREQLIYLDRLLDQVEACNLAGVVVPPSLMARVRFATKVTDEPPADAIFTAQEPILRRFRLHYQKVEGIKFPERKGD